MLALQPIRGERLVTCFRGLRADTVDSLVGSAATFLVVVIMLVILGDDLGDGGVNTCQGEDYLARKRLDRRIS